MLHDLAEMTVESSTWKEKLETSPAVDMCVYNDSSRNSLEGCFCQTKLICKEFISGQEVDSVTKIQKLVVVNGIVNKKVGITMTKELMVLLLVSCKCQKNTRYLYTELN